MEYTEQEKKFIRLGLDPSAQGNEVETSLKFLIKSLRARKVSAEDVLGKSSSSDPFSSMFGDAVRIANLTRSNAALRDDLSRTEMVLHECRQQRDKATRMMDGAQKEIQKLKQQIAALQSFAPAPNIHSKRELEGDNYIIDFGRHNGKRLSQIPIGYLEWCLSTPSIVAQKPDLIRNINMSLGRDEDTNNFYSAPF